MQIKLKQRQSIGLKWIISRLTPQCNRVTWRCSVSIVEISVESFAESTFHVALVLNNTGLSSCSLHFALEQRKNSDFITEEHFQEFHISPMYQQLIYFTLSARKRSRSLPIRMQVTVRESSSNATVAERDVLIKHGHHCTCISRCQCRVSSFGMTGSREWSERHSLFSVWRTPGFLLHCNYSVSTCQRKISIEQAFLSLMNWEFLHWTPLKKIPSDN